MRLRTIAYLAVLVCILSGCVHGVAWLADSSGFVFTTAKGHLIAYDIATKKQRILLTDWAAATTSWPGMSPDGKRIALGQLKPVADQMALQIEVCDLQGKIEFRSKELKLAGFTEADDEFSPYNAQHTQVVWSPDAKQILVYASNIESNSESTILYDIASKKFTVWNDEVPAYFGGSPVRPDGKGFLLVDRKIAKYSWVDWTGSRKPVRAVGFDPVDPNRGPGAIPFSPFSALSDSRWDGARAIMVFTDTRYVVDTQALQLTVEKVPAADSSVGDEWIQSRVRLESGVELLSLSPKANEAPKTVRVVSRKIGASALTEVVAPILDCIVLVSYAPDRKHAIVRVTRGPRASKRDSVFVINNAGAVYDRIAIKEGGGPSDKYEGR